MKKIISYALLIIGTLYVSVIYSSVALLTLFYVEIFMMFMFEVISISNLRHMDVSLHIPIQVTDVGMKIPVEIWVDNRSIFPTGVLAIEVECLNKHTGYKKKAVFYSKADNKRAEHTVIKADFTAREAGRIEFVIKSIRLNDYLGVIALPKFHFDKHIEKAIAVPDIYPVPVNITSRSADFAEESVQSLQYAEDDSVRDTFQIREYRPGDRIRSVHWKLSSKMDELMVREYNEQRECAVRLFVVEEHDMKHRQSSDFIQVLLSVSKGLLASGCMHYVIWYDSDKNDVVRSRIEDEHEMYVMFSKLSIYGRSKHKNPIDMESIRGLYMDKYKGNSAITDIALDTKLQLFINGTEVVQYKPGNIENMLEDTELSV